MVHQTDTSPEADKVLIELWRKATPARKFTMAFDATRSLQESVLAALRQRYPLATPQQLRLRFAAAWLGTELARRAYGPLPDDP